MTDTTTNASTNPSPTGEPGDVAGDTDMAAIEAAIDAHLKGYCEPDPDRRADLIAAAWTEDGELVDPPMSGRGHAELAALTDAVLSHFPGHTFRRTTGIDVHHELARYGWELVGADGSTAIEGVDFVELAGGRIRRAVGFFGPLPARV